MPLMTGANAYPAVRATEVGQRDAQDGDQEAKRQRVDVTTEEPKVVGFDGREFEYCPYNETSKTYDQTRAPLGLNIVLGSACLSPWKLEEQKLLDIGCGTGTFLKAVAGNFKSLDGFDYNDGMLVQAKQRLEGVATISQCSADKLHYVDESFHICVTNQVVHHFPSGGNYAFFRQYLKEAFRVLIPGGCLVLNTSTPDQQRDSFWWLDLFPEASGAICSRFPPLEVIMSDMREAGFQVDADSVAVPKLRTLMSEAKYLEHGVHSAFMPDYRAGDSSWAMAEGCGELDKGLQRLKDMQTTGQDQAWLSERESLRKRVGQATFITARKPLRQ